MPTTAEVIDRLAREARPVRRLRPPALRALVWLAAAAVVVGVIAALEGVRPELGERLRNPWYALSRAGAVATALTAALAAFELSIPDRAPRWLWLPVPFAALWLGSMGYGCIADWVIEGADGLALGHSADCFSAIVITSLPLGALLLVMVRHAGPVRPVATALAAGLALAAVAEGGLTLYHESEATLMDILFHLFGVAAVLALAQAGGRALFRRVVR